MIVLRHAGAVHNEGFRLPGHLKSDTAWMRSGTEIVTLQRAKIGSSTGALLFDVDWRVNDSSGRNGPSDTQLVLDGRTLQMIRARYQSAYGASNLVYAGEAFRELDTMIGVAGVDSSGGSAPAKSYNSVSLPLVIRALPLALGYRTHVLVSVPFSRKRQQILIAVSGRDTVRTWSGRLVDCWRVQAFIRDSPNWFWVSTDSRDDVMELASGDRGSSLVLRK